MTISVDHLTYIISVPKADTTLIQASPEIRELDSNQFRIWLDDWMDSEAGISMPQTHRHNTEVVIDGLAYARTIEILAPYTVQFEDGQWQCNITGSNNNIHSRRVQNQVSLVPSNSAGLINVRASEYASYMDGIAVDVANGVTGTAFPKGSHISPVNNIADALLIAQVRGIESFIIHGSLTLDTGTDISGYRLEGENAITSFLTINSGAVVDNCQFEDLFIIGSVFDGYTYIKHCYISNVSGLEGFIEGSIIAGSLSLTGTSHTFFVDCKSGCVGLSGADLPVLSMAGADRHVAFRNFSGPIKITNSTDPLNTMCVDISSGATVTIDSTCTAGTIYIRGVGNVVNNGTMTVGTAAQLDQTTVASAVGGRIVEGTYTEDQMTRLMSSMLTGKVSGAGTGIEKFRDLQDTKDRVTVSTDANGNRLAVVRNAE